MAQDDNQEKDFLDIDLDDSSLSETLDGALDDAPTEDVIRAPISNAKTGDGVLLFDNKRYAVGLSWLIAEEEGDTELAIQRAKDFKADFYVLRQGVVSQQAFGFLRKGHRIQQPALAAVAADALVGEWHGVFVADNGWWYLAVHADNIAPEGDLLFASEEAAYNHFVAQAEQYRWPRSYAPETWNIPDSSGEIPLNKVISEGTPPVLKPVTLDAIFSGKRNKNLAIVAAMIIIGLIAVSVLGQQILPALVPQQAQIPVPNVDVGDTLQAPPKEPVNEGVGAQESLTKMGLTLPSAMMEACISTFSSITMPLPGWNLTQLRCKESFAEGTWAKVTGSYELIEPYLSRFPDGVQKNFSDAGTMLATRRLAGKIPTMPVGDLLERNYAIMMVSKRFTNLGSLDVKEIVPAASQQLMQGIEMMQQAGFSGLGQNKPDIRPLTRDDLPYLQVTVHTKTPPNLIGKYFDMPGMVVQTLTNQVQNGEWIYDAKIILRPEQRLVDANIKAKAMQIH